MSGVWTQKFDRNSVPLDDDSWCIARDAEDELGGTRAGLRDTSNIRSEAGCLEVCRVAIGKGRHIR
jgi:hypothetical protein